MAYTLTDEQVAAFQRRLIRADLEAQPPELRAETVERARRIAGQRPQSALAKLLKHYEARDGN
jgi:hypothetical protein